MNKKILLGISIVFGIVLFAFVFNLVGTDKVLNALSRLTLSEFFILLSIFLVYWFILFLRLDRVLKTRIDFKIRKRKLILLRAVEYAVSYVTPSARLGGEPAIAYLMKKDLNVSYSKGIATVLLLRLMDFTVGILFLIAGLIYLLIEYSNRLSETMSTLLIMVAVIYVILLVLFYIKAAKKQGFFTMLFKPFVNILGKGHRFHEGMIKIEKEIADFLKKDRKEFYISLLLTLIGNVIYFGMFKLLLYYLGVEASIMQILVIFALSVFAYLIPTPAGLGALEGAMAFAFHTMKLGTSRGVAFGLVQRALELVIVVIGLIALAYFSLKMSKGKLGKAVKIKNIRSARSRN